MNTKKAIQIMESMKKEIEIQLDVLNYYMEQTDKKNIFTPSIINDFKRYNQERAALEQAIETLKFLMLPICKKEPIKLKLWEYDMLDTNDMPHSRSFNAFKTYKHMIARGHFAGIKDTSMTLDDILYNCEIISDGKCMKYDNTAQASLMGCIDQIPSDDFVECMKSVPAKFNKMKEIWGGDEDRKILNEPHGTE